MALNNLSSSLIQNTYGKLVQTEGGLLADGTGSAIDSLTVTASFATVAATALSAPTVSTGSLMTTGSISGNTLTFTKGDNSTFDIELSGTSVDTGSFMTTGSITDATITFTKGDGSTFDVVVNNVVTAQTASYVAGTVANATSASYAVTASHAIYAENGNTATSGILAIGGAYNLSANSVAIGPTTGSINDFHIAGANGQLLLDGKFSGSGQNPELDIRGDVTIVNPPGPGGSGNLTVEGTLDAAFVSTGGGFSQFALETELNASSSALQANIDANSTRIGSLEAATSSYARTDQNNSFTGTQTFNDIAVNGTGSFAYIQQVTGSAKVIGDAFIILNANTPAARYAGLKVYDSGSGMATASLEWDGLNDYWFFEDETEKTARIATFQTGSRGSEWGGNAYYFAMMNGQGQLVNDQLKVNEANDRIEIYRNLEFNDDHSILLADGNINVPNNSITASDGFLGDLIGNADTATTATTANTASYVAGTDVVGAVTLATSADFATLAATANTASYVAGANVDGTVANATSASFAVTASYALTASAADTFTINTELVLADATTSIPVTAGFTTGSLVDNVHPEIASGSAQIKHIVTIDQTAYNTISGSASVSDDTLYIIEDAGDDVYPGNLQVSGQIYSPTFAGTIASSTSSIDFDNGNFATLNCASSTFLANPTNLQSGTTYTIIITNGANISGYGTVFKFAGGTEPTFSANTDILTAVSDGTSLYATGLADFS